MNYKPLSNATAAAWLEALTADTLLEAIKKILSPTSKVSKRSLQGCQKIVASAELVAAFRGHPNLDLPPGVQESLLSGTHSDEITSLNASAIEYLRLLMAESAMKTEMEDAESGPAWRTEMQHLIKRLGSPVPKKAARIRVGDVYDIPLTATRHAFCQVLHIDKRYGYMVEAFKAASLESGSLFPPAFVNLKEICALCRWSRVDNLPVKNFKYPQFKFRAAGPSGNPFTFDWQIWDGTKFRPTQMGILWPGQRNLEFLKRNTAEEIEARIEAALR